MEDGREQDHLIKFEFYDNYSEFNEGNKSKRSYKWGQEDQSKGCCIIPRVLVYKSGYCNIHPNNRDMHKIRVYSSLSRGISNPGLVEQFQATDSQVLSSSARSKMVPH